MKPQATAKKIQNTKFAVQARNQGISNRQLPPRKKKFKTCVVVRYNNKKQPFHKPENSTTTTYDLFAPSEHISWLRPCCSLYMNKPFNSKIQAV